MEIFFTLVVKLIPLYVFIILGVLSGKFLKVDKEGLAKIAFYVITPEIIFTGILKTKLSLSLLSLPFVIFALSLVVLLITYGVARLWWRDSSRNILAFCGSVGNVGYFGLPVAMMLFDEQTLGAYILSLQGVIFFQTSVGFYICAKGRYSSWDSIKKVLYLPTLYAFILGVACNIFRIPLPTILLDVDMYARASYTVFGMMIMGISLTTISRKNFDAPFVGVAMVMKMLLWPALTLFFITCDTLFMGIYTPEVYKTLMLIAISPVAVNSVVIATLVDVYPEKAAAAVLISTACALFYQPLMISLYIL
jgi:malate permease and related proteins